MKFILIALILAGCASTPKQFEDDRVIVLEGRAWVKDVDGMTRPQIEAIAAEYTTPVFDDAERAAYKRMLWGQGADAATTIIGISMGCRELNPIGPVGAIALKVWAAHWYRNEAGRTPRMFSVSKAVNTSALIGGSAALWNLTQVVGGC